MSTISFRSIVFSAISVVIIVLSSCTHNPLFFTEELPVLPPIIDTGGIDTGGIADGIPCDPDTTYFENDILPIFISSCAIAGCHDSITHKEGIRLNNYNNIMASDLINPGHAGSSDLFDVINETDLDDRMPPPPAPPLSAAQKAALTEWINQGALNNSCGEECDTTDVTYGGSIAPIMNAYCNGCHGGSFPSGGISLSSYSGVAAVAADGRLFGSVNHDAGYTAMPQGTAQLSDCKLDKIRIWIENGYLNN